jgi:aspartyl/glutamyl-tRNA(Asn/Gln) amidotransferase C subunit
MAVAIDDEEVRRIAELAQLEPEPHELRSLSRQLGSILDLAAMLDEVELELAAIPSRTAAPAAPARLRLDEPRSGPGAENALRNAPDPGPGYFRVPRVLDA